MSDGAIWAIAFLVLFLGEVGHMFWWRNEAEKSNAAEIETAFRLVAETAKRTQADAEIIRLRKVNGALADEMQVLNAKVVQLSLAKVVPITRPRKAAAKRTTSTRSTGSAK